MTDRRRSSKLKITQKTHNIQWKELENQYFLISFRVVRPHNSVRHFAFTTRVDMTRYLHYAVAYSLRKRHWTEGSEDRV